MVLVFSILLSPVSFSQSKSTHYKLTEKLLLLTGSETMSEKTIDEMMKIQVQHNPALAEYNDVFKEFFNKYMSWESLKEDYIQIYMKYYNEKEIQDLIDFYQTPTGKKSAEIMPQLLAEGAQLGASRVQENMGELQLMIMNKEQEKAAEENTKQQAN